MFQNITIQSTMKRFIIQQNYLIINLQNIIRYYHAQSTNPIVQITI